MLALAQTTEHDCYTRAANDDYIKGGPRTRTKYGYDADNRVITASGGVTLGYDALGRLRQVAGASTTRFLYDGTDVIAEYDAAGTLQRRYVPGPGADETLVWYEGSGSSDRRYPIADERGSVIGVTNGAGNVTQIDKYDSYGVPDPANLGRFQYTGQMWIPEIAAYHYKARAYHPKLGRFMQTDPLGTAGGLNLYGYVGNDPVNLVDPSGLYYTCANEASDCTWVQPRSGCDWVCFSMQQEMQTYMSQLRALPFFSPAGGGGGGAQQGQQLPGNDPQNPDFHEYPVTTQICDSARQFGCSASYVFKEGLDRYPAPGLDGSYVKNGETRKLPGFGNTTFIVDEKNMKITNVTQSDHLLHPGYVERQVVTLDGRVFIQTHGVGTGNLGSLNVAGANILWPSVDAQIARSLNGLFPPTRIVP